MTNTLNKIIHNGDEYELPVTSVNGETGDVTVEEGITKIFTLPSNLTSQAALTVAQDAYDWYLNGGNPIIKITGVILYYSLNNTSTGFLLFNSAYNVGATTEGVHSFVSSLVFTISSGSVTAIEKLDNYIRVSHFTPSSSYGDNYITLVV